MKEISELIIYHGDEYEGNSPTLDEIAEKVNEIIRFLNRKH